MRFGRFIAPRFNKEKTSMLLVILPSLRSLMPSQNRRKLFGKTSDTQASHRSE